MSTLVWFRSDLRTADNPALHDACSLGPVHGVFLTARAQWQQHDVSATRLAFLARSVEDLGQRLATLRIPLHVVDAPRFVDAPAALMRCADRIGARRIAFNDEYALDERRRDARVAAVFAAARIEVSRHTGDVTLPPGLVRTKQGLPYRSFTPFKRRWLEIAAPADIEPLPAPVACGTAIDVGLETTLSSPARLPSTEWPAGEHEAQRRLASFIAGHARNYATHRDLPALQATSRLSPYLAVGAVSSNQCLHAAAKANGGKLSEGPLHAWISELIWREFYRHVVAAFPDLCRGRPFIAKADDVPWRTADGELEAWQAGETGYPLVDAAMKQLNTTGWMHNRLRMVSAMFLSKHLLIDWRLGERYFMQKLIDGDFASNNGGWQWSASTGTDAAPYFRIMNPTAQGQRFDSNGVFTRRMLPALEEIPAKNLYTPHESAVPTTYPKPIVDHKFARQRAIDAFKTALRR